MQRAFYLDGMSLSEVDTYRTIAVRLGLDADAVTATSTADEVRANLRGKLR